VDGLKRGSAAIVGVAESDLGQVADGLSVFDLMAQGVGRALDDCGLKLKDVDGLFSATTQSRLSVLGLAEYLGINPPFLGSTIVGGSSFEYHVAHAMGAIALGLCNVALIAYGSTQRTIGRKQASVREINPYETPFKPFLPSSAFAMAASRHMHQFGPTRGQLDAGAVAARERTHRARGQPCGQHQWRRTVLLPPRHVWPAAADRGGASAARRMRSPAGDGLRGRDGARQWRRAVLAGNRHSRRASNTLTAYTQG